MTTDRMLQFVSTEKAMPDKRLPAIRRHDFAEIYAEFSRTKGLEQAARCSQCGVPFCQTACPLNNNIPDWLMLTAEGRMREAWEVAATTNSFPEICGRICPQDRLCEGDCVIEKGFDSVTIGAVERHITENAFDNGWVHPPTPRQERRQSIGIIGAGPAGLAAAGRLRELGYSIDIYDRYDRVGGLLIYGIPGFKLEKSVVKRREDLLRQAGVHFHLNTSIGAASGSTASGSNSITLTELRQKHDAILIATGVYKARDINAEGVGRPGIIPALEYLTASNRVNLGDTLEPQDLAQYNAKGKHTVVIGGGDTAMDCVRTAIRQDAASVTCLYRRDRANMPGSLREVNHAEEEGVKFQWLTIPDRFDGTGGAVESVVCSSIRLVAADGGGGRAMPQILPNAPQQYKADLVIKALGFSAEDLPQIFNEPSLKCTANGTVAIDWRTMMTSLDGVFAAGDIVRGASLVVWAVRDGQDAAASIHQWLGAKSTTSATPMKLAS